jgi:hypothetical protein
MTTIETITARWTAGGMSSANTIGGKTTCASSETASSIATWTAAGMTSSKTRSTSGAGVRMNGDARTSLGCRGR